ncbi:alpha/beta fold hydrolase [Parafannyhessea umbonata]|uniref:Pimeloyl-ACP methyl ester carboxylesterase n=1 Tax=Parafannyhessea umbonata TaxID=604330 RepID=A0A1G6HTG1_9ACTN|nr:alpha/beta hydrolase [Parafannyhessea umbonata]MBM6988719.1 alpha/beta hydrolase [Parafannyhessea umbonata]SDB97125.1 Pimeloyl-ACP methyl ester carboxylesterase [Parafannyhessea umbonata]
MPERPQLHFPSPYLLPTAHLAAARLVPMADGAQIAAFAYVPDAFARAADAELADAAAQMPDPVLMLHGNGEEHGIFGQVIDAVCASGRPVVAVDSRAQGKSTRGMAELTYELMAGDALAALAALGFGKAHLLGFSDGAIEAIIIARDHPELTLSLLSIGANLSPDGVDDSFQMEQAAQNLFAWADFWEKGDGSHRNVDPSLVRPTPQEARTTAELLHMMVVYPQIDPASLSQIACPTTVMAGEFDEIKREETDLIHVSIPDSRLVIVPGAGHVLPKEAPEDVAREVLATIAMA